MSILIRPGATLEGWRRFVDADPPEFGLLDGDVWARLTDAERTAYDEARVAHHSELVVVTTATVQEIRKQGWILTLLNQREIGARRGLRARQGGGRISRRGPRRDRPRPWRAWGPTE